MIQSKNPGLRLYNALSIENSHVSIALSSLVTPVFLLNLCRPCDPESVALKCALLQFSSAGNIRELPA